MKKRTGILAGAALLLLGGSVQAALLGRVPLTPGRTDYQAYYDTVLAITWVADANLAKTSGYDSAGLTGWAAPDYPGGGISRNDSEGKISWMEANTWITLLNTANYLGVDDWRLPRVVDTTGCGYNDIYGPACGYNVQTKSGDIHTYEVGQAVYSEMAHLHYVTLGNIARYDVSGHPTGCNSSPPYCLTNTGPFSNIQPAGYWAAQGFVFGFGTGGQSQNYGAANYGYYYGFHAWAVRDGDIAAASAVPVPAAGWLFGSALGLFGLARRKVVTT